LYTMYFATIDCGTTNTRIYLLDGTCQVIGRGQKKVGVRDTVINGSNEILKEGLKEAFENTVKDTGLRMGDIELAISAGMITSEIGLIDIPHIPGPAGIDELTRNIKVVRDTAVFPIDIPMIFICGIKNGLPENATYRDIRRADFMRGEEVQALGLIARYGDLRYPVMLTILTSHTKFIYIDEAKRIVGGLSTLSGQIHEAIESATSIGKSIKGVSGDTTGENYFDKGIIDAAYDSVHNAGFLRTILMPRFMDVLLDTQWYERELFLNSAITTEDLRAMNDFGLLGFDKYHSFVLVGDKKRSGIYKYLLEEKVRDARDIKQICEQDEIDRLSIDGAIEVAKKAGYLT
jgi:2-dehydro-3-deoxygalactonokinase